jgi:HTH-type transcriptional regulator / antitoxin HipB
MTIEDIGRFVRSRRRAQGLKQAELAALSNVGTRFLSDLENGKGTVEIGLTLRVLSTLGYECDIRARCWADLEQSRGPST